MKEGEVVKTCTSCFMIKDINDFGFSRPKVRRSKCKSCKNEYNKKYIKNNPEKKKKYAKNRKERSKQYRKENKEKRIEYLKQWGRDNPEKKRAQKYRHRYGIDIQDYNKMLKEQGGVCKICKSKTPKRKNAKYFAVDHCHTTGKVRGLLCYNCNSALGKLNDNAELLKKALDYLLSNSKCGKS